MTFDEKRIYNTYLYVLRRVNNKPFTPRKDFSKIENTEKHIICSKLVVFFEKFQHINCESFFEAPFFVNETEYVDLSFYITQKAINTYKLFHSSFLIENVDSKVNLNKIKNSIKFIHFFSKKNKINMSDYISYYEKEATYPVFLKHLKERRISIFILFAFDDINDILSKIPSSELEIFDSNFKRLQYVKNKFFNSDKMRKNINFLKDYLKKNKHRLSY